MTVHGDTRDEWNWLEWIHHTAEDAAIHMGVNYEDAIAALVNTSYLLAEAWEDGYGWGRDDESAKEELTSRAPNPYREKRDDA